MANESESTIDDELSQLSCVETGDCGIKELSDGSRLTDLTFDLHLEDVKLSRDPETNDLIIHHARILSPGQRNQFWYPLEAVKNTTHLKKKDGQVLQLNEAPSPFVVPHSSNPVDTIGRVDNLRWDELEQSIVGDPRIYDDPRLPLAQAAIAILEKEKGFMSLSTRLKVKPVLENKSGKNSVDDLRLIHVAWVDVGADPTAGRDLSNEDASQASSDASPETVDLALLPLADRNTSWDGGAAEKAVWAWANGDGSKAGKAYFWKDSNGDPNLRQSYKLPFADVVNGTLTAIPSGIIAAFGSMRGSRGSKPSIPAGDVSGVLSKIKSYYDKMGMNWPLSSGSSSNSSVSAPLKNENRGIEMSETDEAQNVGAGEEQGEEQNQPVTPPVENEETQASTPSSFSEMADNEEVTMTAGQIRKTLADMKADLWKDFQDQQERDKLIGEITSLDKEVPSELLESLRDNKQLRLLKDIIERLFNQITERDNSIATLESKQYHATGEKPSLSVAPLEQEDLSKKAEKYFGAGSQANSVRDKMRGVAKNGGK